MFTKKDIRFRFNAEHKFWEMLLRGYGMRFACHTSLGIAIRSRKPNRDSQDGFVTDCNDRLQRQREEALTAGKWDWDNRDSQGNA